MSQYTVFYNSDKEIEMVLNGQADSATISAQEGTGLSTLVVDVDNTPTDHYYVNDAEDGVVLKSTFGISLDSMEKNVDEAFTFSNVPEGTSINISGVISGTMDASSTLTLTATTAGEWKVIFTKDKYFELVFMVYAKRKIL
jgi:hypothetical protein